MTEKEAIRICKKITTEKFNLDYSIDNIDKEAIETVLNYIENSIPKEIIENYLKDEKKKFEIYKKGSKENENLKGQMWHHMGAKNMCERLLGIERNITTLD